MSGQVDRTHHDAILDAISQITTVGDFCAFGSLFTAGLLDPGLSVQGVGLIDLPLNAEQTETLIAASRTVHYGELDTTTPNTDIKQPREIAASRMSFGQGWNYCLDEALEKIRLQMGLGPDIGSVQMVLLTSDVIAHVLNSINMEPHKLLIYEKGIRLLTWPE
jgi:hypothetical protein